MPFAMKRPEFELATHIPLSAAITVAPRMHHFVGLKKKKMEYKLSKTSVIKNKEFTNKRNLKHAFEILMLFHPRTK